MTTKNQPKINIKLSNNQFFWEIFSFVLLILYWLYITLSFRSLPSTIPTHYNFKGEPDAFGSSGTIFLLPIIGTFILIGFSALSKIPHHFNYLVVITEENAEKQYSTALTMLRFLKITILFVFIFIDYRTIQLAKKEDVSGQNWTFMILPLIIFIPVIYYIFQSFRKNKEVRS